MRKRYSSYMTPVIAALGGGGGRQVLDVPCGAGWLGRALRENGWDVTEADIEPLTETVQFADLNQPLPFRDGQFDAVTCLEGIEHVLNPYLLLSELVRVVKPGGQIVVSTPNISNLYSRLIFLFTGTFYLFNPSSTRQVDTAQRVDRGHISPLSYQQIGYLGGVLGCDAVGLRTDRFKKKWLLPLYPFIWLVGKLLLARWLLLRAPLARRDHADRNRRLYRDLFSLPLLFGRTLIVFLRKRAPAG
jgi:SAM-dependent methyltransferase